MMRNTKWRALWLALWLVGVGFGAMTVPISSVSAQDAWTEFQQRIMQRLARLQADPNNVDIRAANGIWKLREMEDYYIAQIAMGDIVYTQGISKETESFFDIGGGEDLGDYYNGYWSYVCKDCCVGHTYWDPGAMVVGDDRFTARITVFGKKIDPDTCEKTETPDEVVFTMDKVDMLEFKEHIPGKYIHIVAAPAVGNQGAQYQASVKIGWTANFPAVRKITLVTQGQMILNESTQLTGEYEYLTNQSGECSFMIVAYGDNNRVLHIQTASIEIPNIPGIN